ncbi:MULTISPECIES: glycosyltransferase family 32 protein [unclassified Bifidobacterium]|uniref:glycosyltransferase family 32 protein n=1 Tax=unclassified Bifidobacterium TaxID=2608897 RepID=UPI00112EAA0A|nr:MULTISPECIES: glycosyltransferase [unclassified Bifidobacterium]
MIPRKIHYIWLGGKDKPSLTKLCINTWKRVLPDYEIIEWNEDNLDLNYLKKNNKFLSKCLDLKLWSFASDYLRLYVLYKEGGVYLDTDIEVIKKYDSLLNESMFIGLEDKGFIGTGVIGSEKNNPIVKRILDFYNVDIWNVDIINNPMIFKYLYESEPDLFVHCNILPRDVFAPYAPGQLSDGVVESDRTISIHWYSLNWNLSLRGYVFATTKHIKNPFIRLVVSLKKAIGYEMRYRK